MRDGNFTPVTDRRRDVSLDFDRSIQRSDRTGIHLKTMRREEEEEEERRTLTTQLRIKSRTTRFACRNSRTSIVLATLCPIATILLFPPLSTATPFRKFPRISRREKLSCVNEGLNGVEIFCLQSRNVHGPYPNFRNEHSRFFYTARFLDPVQKTCIEHSNIPSSNPAFLVDGSCPLAADFPIFLFFLARSWIVSRHDAPSRSPDVSPSCLPRSRHGFPLPFFLTLGFRLLSCLHDRWTPCFRCVRVEKGVGSVARIVRTESFFPFPRKVVAPWRGMRARNHHE